MVALLEMGCKRVEVWRSVSVSNLTVLGVRGLRWMEVVTSGRNGIHFTGGITSPRQWCGCGDEGIRPM